MTVLRTAALEATWLPEHGMVGASLIHEGAELLGQRGGLDAYLAKGSAFGIPLLAPWANRLDGLRYAHVEIDPARVKGGAEGLPKDGAMNGREWTVEAEEATRLVASFDATADEDVLAVFPFPHRLRVTVQLDDNAMAITTELAATSDVPVPIAFGWHPLFTVPDTERSELEVVLPVDDKLELDDRGIPTGRRERTAWTDGVLGDRVIDAEYPDVRGDFLLRGGGREVCVSFGGPDYPVGHAWAPAGETFVAWEPMTAPTNALVTGDGLRHVQPGDAFSAQFTVRVQSI